MVHEFLDSLVYWRHQDRDKLFFWMLNIITLQLTVPDMACSACVTTITNAVKEIDATATVAADPKTKLVNIETQQSETVVKQAIVAAGYTIAQ